MSNPHDKLQHDIDNEHAHNGASKRFYELVEQLDSLRAQSTHKEEHTPDSREELPHTD